MSRRPSYQNISAQKGLRLLDNWRKIFLATKATKFTLRDVEGNELGT